MADAGSGHALRIERSCALRYRLEEGCDLDIDQYIEYYVNIKSGKATPAGRRAATRAGAGASRTGGSMNATATKQ